MTWGLVNDDGTLILIFWVTYPFESIVEKKTIHYFLFKYFEHYIIMWL